MIATDDNMGCGTCRAADLLLPARGPSVTLIGARQRRAALELEPDRCGGRHAGQDVNLVATATLRLRRGPDPTPGFGGWKCVHRGPPLERAVLRASERSSRGGSGVCAGPFSATPLPARRVCREAVGSRF